MQRIIPHSLVDNKAPGEAKRGNSLFFMGSLLLFLLAAFVSGGLFFLIKREESTQVDYRTQIDRKASELRASDIVTRAVDLEKRIGNMKSILDTHSLVTNTLRFMEAIVHPQVRFIGFDYRNETRAITTKAATRGFSTVSQQIEFIKRDPNVERVDFGGLNVDDKGSVEFSLAITMKPVFATMLLGSNFGIPVSGGSVSQPVPEAPQTP